MHRLICFEGTSYVSKTTVSKLLSRMLDVKCGPRVAIGWEGREEKIHQNPDPLARFSFFMEEIAVRSQQIETLLEQANVILDRYLLSVLAYHNVIVGTPLEADFDRSKVRQPDFTVLLTANEMSLKQRMQKRPPRHHYESDLTFLVRVEHEFVRLIERDKTIVVDTSVQSAENITQILFEELVRRGFVLPQRGSKT